MEPASLTESAVTDRSDSLNKRKYDTISDEDRLKLILLIKDFGMSCHKASKVLDIAYNNAKVIYRIYKNEKRIRQTPKQQKRHAKMIRADTQRQRMLEREARIAAMMDDEASDTSEDEENEDDFGDDGFDFGHDDYLEAEELDSSSDFGSEDKSLLYDTTYLQEPQKSGFSIGTSFRNLTSGMTDSVSAIPDENLL